MKASLVSKRNERDCTLRNLDEVPMRERLREYGRKVAEREVKARLLADLKQYKKDVELSMLQYHQDKM